MPLSPTARLLLTQAEMLYCIFAFYLTSPQPSDPSSLPLTLAVTLKLHCIVFGEEGAHVIFAAICVLIAFDFIYLLPYFHG